MPKYFGFGITQYNCSIDFPEDKKIIAVADNILCGKMIVKWRTPDFLEYDVHCIEKFDWDIQCTESPNTFQLYLQGLNQVVYLARAYAINGNEQYIKLADEIIDSWMQYKSLQELDKTNPFLWHGHSTSIRTENLIYYAVICDDKDCMDSRQAKKITELLLEHGNFLMLEGHYIKNHNYGIFQDRALIYIAYFLKTSISADWVEIAKKRLKLQKEYAFNSEKVHVENSPNYQYAVMDAFVDIARFLIQYGDLYGEELCADISKAAEFMAWMIKPNGITAEIGDTSSIADYVTSHIKDLSQYNNDSFLYASTFGSEGIAPNMKAVIYPMSGYLFSRGSWEKDSFRDATWCMFKAGYSSKTHKHADDLSFMLYSKGYDIFVDPGGYNYVVGDVYRDYFVSSRAHNTVIVDGKTYSTTAENSEKTGIIDYNLNDLFDYALGFNDMYDGVEIDRHFYRVGDAFILFDDIVSNDRHEYSQLFQLSEEMQIIESNCLGVLMRLGDTPYNVRIRQLGNQVPQLTIINGDSENGYGHISRGQNLLTDSFTIKFDLVGDRCNYITVITIEDYEGNVIFNKNMRDDPKIPPQIGLNGKSVQLGNINIELRERKRFGFENVKVTLNNDMLIAVNDCECENSDISYAWYLIDKKSARVVTKSVYSTDNTFRCMLSRGEYLLKAYMKFKSGQRKQRIVAYIENNTGGGMLKAV